MSALLSAVEEYKIAHQGSKDIGEIILNKTIPPYCKEYYTVAVDLGKTRGPANTTTKRENYINSQEAASYDPFQDPPMPATSNGRSITKNKLIVFKQIIERTILDSQKKI
jgi:hypothetical protein